MSNRSRQTDCECVAIPVRWSASFVLAIARYCMVQIYIPCMCTRHQDGEITELTHKTLFSGLKSKPLPVASHYYERQIEVTTTLHFLRMRKDHPSHFHPSLSAISRLNCTLEKEESTQPFAFVTKAENMID